jgi:hypothetical protein
MNKELLKQYIEQRLRVKRKMAAKTRDDLRGVYVERARRVKKICR